MRFAVISDLHVRIDGLLYGLDTQKRLDDVLSDIDREAPDLVVVTGDLADCADLGSYRLIKERLESLSRPVYVLPGNHDDPVQMRQIFPAAPAVSVFFTGRLLHGCRENRRSHSLISHYNHRKYSCWESFSRSSAADTAYET